jgi:TetR/AcrR family transcriptional regulator
MVKLSSKARRAPRRATPPADVDTESRILAAAHTVFVRRGTAGARMQEIAETAGVNSALLHYYFRSKERLSEAVFRRAAGQLLPSVIAILASERSLEEKVHAVIDVELTLLLRAPYLPGYVLSELSHHPERAGQLLTAVTGLVPTEVGHRVLAALRAQITAAVKQRQMHPMAPEQFVVNLLALCVFPFAARPMLMALFGADDKAFTRFIDHRRRELPAFFLRALRP